MLQLGHKSEQKGGSMGFTFKAARVNANYTQTEASEKIGISLQTLSDWERGKRYPSVLIAKRMADLYGIKLDDFILE